MWDLLFVTSPWQRRQCCCGGLGQTRVALLLALLVFVLVLWRWCPFRLGLVRGSSMYPAMRHGQVFLFQRDYYKAEPIRRGDVVLVRVDGVVCVKRVYAVSGDLIWELRSKDAPVILVDPDRQARLAQAMSGRIHGLGRLVEVRMPPESLFVLGDNIGVSCDSRHFGPVSQSRILGRVLGIGHGKPAPPGVVLRTRVHGRDVIRL